MNKPINLQAELKLHPKGFHTLGEFTSSEEFNNKYDREGTLLKHKVSGETALFLISLDGIYTVFGKHTHFEGIELLKWLRINRIYNHCILTSFLSLHEIVQKSPNNSIVASKGTSFVQLPCKIEFDTKCVDPKCLYANEYELKQVFRTEIDIATIRHEEANWWGLYKLYFYHANFTAYSDAILDAKIREHDQKIQNAIIRFCNTSDSDGNLDLQKENKPIRPLLNNIRSIKPNPFVVFIDDQADEGWSLLIEDIIFACEMSNFLVINPVISDTVQDLYNVYKDKTRKNIGEKAINLLISDLRLSKEEEGETDYRKLKSFELINSVRKLELEKKNYNFKVMYLTAANNLSMYKNLLITKNHRPHKLFVKEGIEMHYNDRQSCDNYKELLKTLFDLLKRNGAKKTEENVEDFDAEEELRMDEIMDNLEKYQESQKENLKIRSKLEAYSKIIVDTNVFLNEDKPLKTFKILLNNKDKLIVHIAVKKELELLYQHQEGLKSKMAGFYLDFINICKIEVFNDPKIDFKTMGEEFADKHLVNFTKYYLNQNHNQKILFVSNDMKPNPPGPYYELKKYNLRNLTVWNHDIFINQSNSR